MDVSEWIAAISAVIAAGSAGLVLWQIRLAKLSARESAEGAARSLEAADRSAAAAEASATAQREAAGAQQLIADLEIERSRSPGWDVRIRGRWVYVATNVGHKPKFNVAISTNTNVPADEFVERLDPGATAEFHAVIAGGDEQPRVLIQWTESQEPSAPLRKWTSSLPR